MRIRNYALWLTLVLLVSTSSTAVLAAWSILNPYDGKGYSRTATVSCSGSAGAAITAFSLELLYADSMQVDQSTSGTSTMMLSWAANLVPPPDTSVNPPVNQWEINRNPASITLLPVGDTNVVTHVNFN